MELFHCLTVRKALILPERVALRMSKCFAWSTNRTLHEVMQCVRCTRWLLPLCFVRCFVGLRAICWSPTDVSKLAKVCWFAGQHIWILCACVGWVINELLVIALCTFSATFASVISSSKFSMRPFIMAMCTLLRINVNGKQNRGFIIVRGNSNERLSFCMRFVELGLHNLALRKQKTIIAWTHTT